MAAGLTGCPQFVSDDFEKSEEEANGGSSDSTSSGATGSDGTSDATGGLIIGGSGGAATSSGAGATGGSGGSASTTPSTTSGAGASNTGGSGASGGSGGSGTDSTGAAGSGGDVSDMPTTLVYATTEQEVYAAAWDGAAFGSPELWNTADGLVGFVVAQMAPDRSWGVTAYQGQGGTTCPLWVHRHSGTTSDPPLEIAMDGPASCLAARAFDVAFEQQGERALLVYAAGTDLEYRIIERDSVSEPTTIAGDSPNATVNWVRLAPDLASNHIALGYTSNGVVDPLMVQEWDAQAFGASERVGFSGSILREQSFDLAYHQGSLIAVRGDTGDDGFSYAVRTPDGEWSEERTLDEALDGNARNVELYTMPYGIAGVLYDSGGSTTALGSLFWQDSEFVEETPLDDSLPDPDVFEPASVKADLARLGDAAVAVYADGYGAEGSAIGWAARPANGPWTAQQNLLPVPIDQETPGSYARSLRLARFETDREGLVLVFADDDGLFATSLTSLSSGWAEPLLIEAQVEGADSTPFAIAGPFP